MKIKRFFLLVGLVLMALLLVGCSQKVEIVPDSILEELVASATTESGWLDADDFPYTWTAEHKHDPELHTDTVNIKITMQSDFNEIYMTNTFVYEYNRTSDLWRKKSGRNNAWEVDFKYTDGIIGTHECDMICLQDDYDNQTCTLTIHNVTDTTISFTAVFNLSKFITTNDNKFGWTITKLEEYPSVHFTVSDTIPNQGDRYIECGKWLPDVYEKRPETALSILLPLAFDSSYKCYFSADELW